MRNAARDRRSRNPVSRAPHTPRIAYTANHTHREPRPAVNHIDANVGLNLELGPGISVGV